ncbi:hypothetical protein [Pseudaestuariivita atlantica]|uniref:hypothetical protein n=1 Tax=Pseudaestuariivita atlantica TaxID=1317121 RepID=UPI00067BF0CD|nr:hypothetical protein [Pseudaestuariivita atlantica]
MADEKDAFDPFLDELFAEASERDAHGASPDLLARVLGDAEAVQEGFVAPVARPSAPPRVPFWQSVLDAIGGWPAAAGLAAAGVAGVWIGVAPPEALEFDMATMLGVDDGLASIGLVDGSGFFGDALLDGIGESEG